MADYLTQYWSFDPFDVLVLLVAAVHLRGLALRLTAIGAAGRPRAPWIGQAVLFHAGLAVLVIAVSSPLDHWSDSYLAWHIVQHILLGFVAPTLIVLGAPWVPLLRGLPREDAAAWALLLQRTRRGRGAGPLTRALGAVRTVAARPWTSVIGFNVSMVLWHLPGPFALAEANPWVHILLAHGMFFGFGMALFLQVYGSYPFRPVLSPVRRIAALLATNAVMVAVAMTLVMFSHDLYPLYALGHTPEQQAADQQIAGSILWVCGEITFLPSIMYLVAKSLVDRPEASGAAVHTGRGTAPAGQAAT